MLFRKQPVDWPLDSNVIRRNSNHNTFGMVRTRADRSPKPHQGWDFYAKEGTDCYAVSDGVVVFAGNAGDFGKMIVLEIVGTGVFAAYAHLSEIRVRLKEVVFKGELIGKTGCTGNAEKMTGDDQHLHFEIRTIPLPGLGLEHRLSPLEFFGVCPLHEAILRENDDA